MSLTTLQAAARVDGIGASEVASILGVNPWESAGDLYLRKTGRLEPIDLSDAIEWGNDLEPVIGRRAGRVLGKRVVRATGTFKHPNGVMFANVDFMVEKAQRGSPIVEAKSTSLEEGWGEDGSDQVPDHVWVQAQCQMMCAGSQIAYIARILGRYGFKFSMHPIASADNDVRELIEHRVCDFWEKNVRRDTPPDSLPSLESLSSVARRAVSVPIQSDLLRAYMDAKRVLKEAEEVEKAAKTALLADLCTSDGEYAEAGECEAGSVTYRSINTNRVDLRAIEEEHPEIYAKYVRPSSYRRLMCKAAKGAGS